MTAKAWLHSMVAGAIGGASSALVSALAAPDTFNFSHEGLVRLARVALLGGVVPVLMFLKQSPLPSDSQTITVSQTVSKTPGEDGQ